ncbi:MAG: HEPN domain-containing protein [Bacteroidales bacterium]|jgi:uncharacterized protein (UPF0332 family)|nr:HEPN domain-containing protein [Bacteroidales bacterium]
MRLKDTERKEVVKYRLEKARETLAEIPVLFENKLYRTAANRLYYACFYAATALLIKDGYEAHTHSGVKTLLGLHYINENKLAVSLGKTYNHLFNMRQKGDYFDLITVNESDIIPLFEPAENFIAEIEKLINENIT